MAQALTIQLSKGDSPNLGFRLQGGTDFAAPLVIQKVNGGSPAERAGLIAGDAVVKINNTDVYNLRHKDAQDVIIKAGPSFTITVQRGGSTWKPSVVPIGSAAPGNVSPVTRTSLASHQQQNIGAIGTGHNVAAKPYLNGSANGGPRLVNKQYNSPLGLYSEQSIAETISAQSEVLKTGALGIDFEKNKKVFDSSKSEVLNVLKEVESSSHREIDSEVEESGVVTAPMPVVGLKHVQAPENRPAPPTPQLPPGQNICADCERLIVGVFVRIKDKNLHVECFKCSTCGASLKNVGYYNINNKLYCDIHAKLAAKSNPPGPNLIPVTLPPSAKPPTSTISAALSSHSLPSPGPISPRGGPLSPSSNITAAPFQPEVNDEAQILKQLTLKAARRCNASFDDGETEHKSTNHLPSNDSKHIPITNTQITNKAGTNYSNAPRPFSSVSAPLSPSNYPKPLPKTQAPLSPLVAPPVQAPPPPAITPDIKTYNIVWPPVNGEPELPTASPLYFPPPTQFNRPESLEVEAVELDYTELEDYSNILRSMDPRMSMCSNEVYNINGRRSTVECAETISEHLATQMLIENVMKSRPKTPPPIEADIVVSQVEKMEEKKETNGPSVQSVCPCAASCCNESVCEMKAPAELKRPNEYASKPAPQVASKIQNSVPQGWESQMVSALRTASPDPFKQIPQKHSSTPLASALSIAPPEPFNAINPLMTTFEHVPFPEQTVPYLPPEHPVIPAEPKPEKKEIEKPSSPFIEALKIAPDRPFTPVGGAAPVRKKKPQPDPLFKDLPKPQERMSMLDALTTASDRSFTPVSFEEEKMEQQKVEQQKVEQQKVQRKLSIKQPNPQPFISTMVNTFEGGAENANHAQFPPVSIELQQSYDNHADYEQVRAELSAQIEEQHSATTVQEQIVSEKCTDCAKKLVARQAEEIILKKPMNLTGALHKSQALPSYQSSLEYDEELELPHHKNINKLLNPHKPSRIIPDTRPLLRPDTHHNTQTPPPQIIKPVTTIKPGESNPNIQHVSFQTINDDFIPPNSAFSQRVATPGTPSRINKPPSAIPYYQQNLVASEHLAPESNLFDPKSPAISRSPSPCMMAERSASPFKRAASPRAKSPAPGPPPNPLKKHETAQDFRGDFKVEKAKESLTNYIPQHRDALGHIQQAEGDNYDRMVLAQSMSQAQTSGRNFQEQSYEAQRRVEADMARHQQYQQGGMSVSMSEKQKLEQSQQLKQLESKSVETSGGVQVQRTRKVTEEFEHSHKEVEIEKAYKGHPFQKVNVPTIEEQGIIGLHVTNPQPLSSPFHRIGQAVPPPPPQPSCSMHQKQPQPVPPPIQPPKKPQTVPTPSKVNVPVVPPITKPTTQNVKPSVPAPALGRQTGGSVFAPKRGRGVLNVGGGNRIPLCGCCNQQIRVEITTKTLDLTDVGNAIPVYNEINVTIPYPNSLSSENSSPKSYVTCASVSSSDSPAITRNSGYLETTFPADEESPNKIYTSRITRLIKPNLVNKDNKVCSCCDNEIRGPFITALGKIWCPEHFTCATPSCKRPLQDIGFVEEKGQLHCEYCFEQYLAPNCSKCNAKIKGDCLKAIGKNFHPECFNCSYCGKLFGNSPFFLEDGLPYCETDWNEMFTTKCFACGYPVEAGDRWVEALNNNYHSQCFNCTMCKKNLEGQSFFAKGGRPFCKNHAR